MSINFNSITLEVIDINTNTKPDIFINRNNISFSKRVLEDLNYPQFVQYCLDVTHKIFAIRVCKGSEAKATPFAKSKTEQSTTFICSNKNLREVIIKMIPDYAAKQRYKVTGEYDTENRVMYFDMATAEKSTYHRNAEKEE